MRTTDRLIFMVKITAARVGGSMGKTMFSELDQKVSVQLSGPHLELARIGASQGESVTVHDADADIARALCESEEIREAFQRVIGRLVSKGAQIEQETAENFAKNMTLETP